MKPGWDLRSVCERVRSQYEGNLTPDLDYLTCHRWSEEEVRSVNTIEEDLKHHRLAADRLTGKNFETEWHGVWLAEDQPATWAALEEVARLVRVAGERRRLPSPLVERNRIATPVIIVGQRTLLFAELTEWRSYQGIFRVNEYLGPGADVLNFWLGKKLGGPEQPRRTAYLGPIEEVLTDCLQLLTNVELGEAHRARFEKLRERAEELL